MRYIVTARVRLEHIVEADSKAEAERKADQIGALYAEHIWEPKKDDTYWTARKYIV